MHCGRFIDRPLTRRQMLARCANGFGSLALAALLADRAFAGGIAPPGATSSGPSASVGGPFAPRPPHSRAPARNVIFLYMDGGPSQVDTFDPKPLLEKEHGQPFKMKVEPTQFANNG